MADSNNTIVAVRELEGRGRGVVATRPIKAGEIILKDSPLLLYFANPSNKHFCSNCFRKLNPSSTSSPLTCPCCSHNAIFCSPNCLSTALSSSHSPWVCQALSSPHLHSLPLDDISEAYFLIAGYNLAVLSPSRFKLLLSLEGEATPNDPKALALHYLISSLSPPKSFAGISLELTAALLAKDKRNAFALMEPFQENVEMNERNARAYGIYPNASFFNHDCLPNAARFEYVDGNIDGNCDIVVRAIHDFPQGREICLSYFPVNWSYKDRQKRLREDYCFVCDCDRCKVEVNWKDDEEENDSMEETEDEQMVGSGDEDDTQGEADFPHAYFFLKYVCDRDNCGGTLAPPPPSEVASSYIMECNVCGRLRSEEEVDEDGDMVDE